jgi:hypothetical protein
MKRKRRSKTSHPPSMAHESALVPLSCPDCFGVLRREREGVRGHLLYRCQVDHRYTTGSLLLAKEAQLERTLWSATLLLKQMGDAYQDLLAEAKKASGVRRARVRQRIYEVRKHFLIIRELIETSHAVD